MSTFSTELRVELIGDGERSSTWGQQTNTNLQLIESAIAGMVTVATTGGTTTLTATNGVDDQSRHAILKVTGVLVSNATIEIPAVTKQYLVWNATTGSYTLTVKTAAGTGPYIAQGSASFVFCDATDVFTAGRGAMDSTFTIYDNVDPTKQMQFQLSGITTGQTRTLTVPDASDTLAALAATQALTNKTYNGNTWTAGTGTLTLGAGSTLATSATNSITLTSTGATNVTLPTTGTLATLAGAEALTNKSYNGNTWTAGTGTLTLGAGKTLTATASLTLAGTDGKTLTLSDSATIATNAITLGGTEVLTLAAAKNVTFADAFATSGAFSLTLTATGATNVTLPTTGTLAALSVVQTFTASQRGTVTTDNDGSFDMAVTNNFKCTPTAGFTLTFTNITAGQSGFILLVNGSNYAIAAAATTKVDSSFLALVSATGTYLVSYMSDGTNVYCVASKALA